MCVSVFVSFNERINDFIDVIIPIHNEVQPLNRNHKLFFAI